MPKLPIQTPPRISLSHYDSQNGTIPIAHFIPYQVAPHLWSVKNLRTERVYKSRYGLLACERAAHTFAYRQQEARDHTARPVGRPRTRPEQPKDLRGLPKTPKLTVMRDVSGLWRVRNEKTGNFWVRCFADRESAETALNSFLKMRDGLDYPDFLQI